MVARGAARAKEAKEFYATIGSVLCPVLGGETVVFNMAGFRHLTRKGGMRRSKKDQERRFALLPYASSIISYPHTSVISKSAGNATFWILQAERDERIVTVVIRQLIGGRKHFFSIFSGKKKPPSG